MRVADAVLRPLANIIEAGRKAALLFSRSQADYANFPGTVL
jgi:hypothetical protein